MTLDFAGAENEAPVADLTLAGESAVRFVARCIEIVVALERAQTVLFVFASLLRACFEVIGEYAVSQGLVEWQV